MRAVIHVVEGSRTSAKHTLSEPEREKKIESVGEETAREALKDIINWQHHTAVASRCEFEWMSYAAEDSN